MTVFPSFHGFNHPNIAAAAADGLIESVEEFVISMADVDTTATATISSVTTARSCVFFSFAWIGGQRQTATTTGADNVTIRIDLTNATTVTATREVSTQAMTITGTVVQFADGKTDSIQQGTVQIVGNATTNTATISSVTTARSAVLFNGGTTTDTQAADVPSAMMTLSLTNATTVTGVKASSLASTADTNFVVIEFAAGVTNNIQEVNITVANTASSNTATITSVDTSNTVLFPGGWLAPASNWVGTNTAFTTVLTNATTVTMARNGTSGENQQNVTAVEFVSGELNSVQRGTISVGSTDTQVDETITSVDTSKSIVNVVGCNNVTASTVDPEEEWFTAVLLNATTVRVNRGLASARTISVAYEVIEGA